MEIGPAELKSICKQDAKPTTKSSRVDITWYYKESITPHLET
jgi:hypothetical protein